MCDKYQNQRYLMWCDLIPGYADMDRKDKRRASHQFALNCGKQNANEIHTYKELHNLYPAPQLHPLFVNTIPQQQEGQETMCYGQTTANVTIQGTEKKDEALRYIRDRAREIFYEKARNIDQLFEDPVPKTKKEAEKWLKDGNYRVDIHDCDGFFTYSSFAWGKEAPDHNKEQELRSTLDKDLNDLKDTVSIVTDEQTRLQALKDFEAKVYN